MHAIAATLATATCFALAGGAAHATAQADLDAIVDQRLAGDRSGACLAVAVVDAGTVTRTFRCADPADAGRIDADTAFEIGSVSKTMAASLLADLIVQGRASLDDPLSAYLPDGTTVPAFEGAPILLRHLVTHTSGLPALPSRMLEGGLDMVNPYAALSAEDLLASLQGVALAAAPGTTFEYNNFASMLLSYAIARRAGTDFESLLKQRLFGPLGMDRAYVEIVPEGVRAATGHTLDARPASAWGFAVDLSGVGGVRATLDDMVRYLQGNLGLIESSISPALELAQKQVGAQPPMAMNWMLQPVAERTVHMHEGATGGFSSFVSVDRERRRGVVILSDTSWHAVGNLGSLGLHLVDASFALGKPRLASSAAALPDEALAAYAGDYALMPGVALAIRARDGQLHAQATGQGEFALDATAADTFEAAAHGIEIVFGRDAAGEVTSLELHQAGQVLSGKRN